MHVRKLTLIFFSVVGEILFYCKFIIYILYIANYHIDDHYLFNLISIKMCITLRLLEI